MPTDNPQTQRLAAATARINDRVEQGAERVEQGVQSAADTAIQQVRDARERAESGLEQQRAMVSGRVRRFGDALRNTSDQLTGEDQFVQELLDGASDRVQRVAQYIDHARPEDVAYDLQSFARRQPALFFGGAFLVGLAIGRFAKSSSHGVQAPSAAPTSRVTGSAFGAEVPFSAPVNQPPQPQPATASTQPRTTEPGQGNKS